MVVCGGMENCKPDYAVHRETFEFYSIEYVAHGCGDLKLNGFNYPLQTGRVFSYGPGIPHHMTSNIANPLVKYFIDFTGTQAKRIMCSYDLSPGRCLEIFPPAALKPIFDELIEAGLHGRHVVRDLTTRLLECLVLKIAVSQAPIEASESHAFEKFQLCRNYIEENYLRLRTLAEVAKECHIDKAYLCRLFQRFDKQSPYQCLRRLKIKYAAERLQQQPNALVKQVAQEVGFDDPFHFSRIFSSIIGVSPNRFKNIR